MGDTKADAVVRLLNEAAAAHQRMAAHVAPIVAAADAIVASLDRKSTRLNSSH